jgi:hypothetical protein
MDGPRMTREEVMSDLKAVKNLGKNQITEVLLDEKVILRTTRGSEVRQLFDSLLENLRKIEG